MKQVKMIVAGLVLAGAAWTTQVGAAVVSLEWSVTGVPQTTHGPDWLELYSSGPTTTTLTVGTPRTEAFNAFNWFVVPAAGFAQYDFALTRSMTVQYLPSGTPQTFSVTQNAHITKNNPVYGGIDSLVLDVGSPTTVDLGGGYQITVTPLRLVLMDPPGNNPDNALGSFEVSVTPVPEVTTFAAGVLLLLPFGISTFRVFRRNRAD